MIFQETLNMNDRDTIHVLQSNVTPANSLDSWYFISFDICVDCESCEMKELILLHVIASLALCQQFHQPQDFQRNYNHDHNHQVLHNDINQERE